MAKNYQAYVLGSDPELDMAALLKVNDKTELPAAKSQKPKA